MLLSSPISFLPVKVQLILDCNLETKTTVPKCGSRCSSFDEGLGLFGWLLETGLISEIVLGKLLHSNRDHRKAFQ